MLRVGPYSSHIDARDIKQLLTWPGVAGFPYPFVFGLLILGSRAYLFTVALVFVVVLFVFGGVKAHALVRQSALPPRVADGLHVGGIVMHALVRQCAFPPGLFYTSCSPISGPSFYVVFFGPDGSANFGF